MIHHQNILPLAIEIYIVINNLSGEYLHKFFVRNNRN